MTVALVDWHWSGHHPTYFIEYTVALAGLGHRVLPLCPDPENFRKRLLEIQLSRETAERIEEPQALNFPAPSRMRPARWRGIHEAVRQFGGLGDRLRLWERNHGAKIDLVFFACMYDRLFRHFRLAQVFFRFPCAGMYMEGRFFRMPGVPIPFGNGMPCPDRFLPSRSLKAVAILDETLVEPIRRLSGGKRVVVFPDVTHETPVPEKDEAQDLARRAREFAAGRPIVALVGHLQWTKGLEEFTALARHESMKNVAFLLAGPVSWSDLSAKQQAELRHAWATTRNLMTHLENLPEAVMNAAVAASDVIFAAYRAFPNNSNILTKAAICEKPVLVSEGHLMARMVREYQMGEAAAEGDVEKLVQALQRMVAPGYAQEIQTKARWRDYRAKHAAARLPDCFRELLHSEREKS